MTPIDEITRECLAIRVARRIDGVETMADVMRTNDVPEHIWIEAKMSSGPYHTGPKYPSGQHDKLKRSGGLSRT